MAHSPAALGRTTPILLALGFALLTAITVAAFWLSNASRERAEYIEQTRLLRAAVVRVQGLLLDAETGQRGYLLARDQRYLEPYTDARRDLEARLGELAARPTEPVVQRLRDEIITLTRAKMSELQATVDLARAGRWDEALAVITTDRGKAMMDDVRQRLSAILDLTDERLRAENRGLVSHIEVLSWIIGIGGLLIALVAAFSIRTVRRSTAELQAAQASIEATNAQLDERVRERTFELEQANEEIQRFAYIVSHDLRSPLVNVMGFTAELELATDTLRAFAERVEAEAPALVTDEVRAAATGDAPEAIRFIRASTEKMDRLINAILKISREGRRTLTPARVRMGEVVDSIVDSVRHRLAEADATLTVEDDLPDLVSDRLALDQVFGNLIDNALKYLQPGRPGQIRIRGRAVGRMVVYEVADNGRGVDPKDRQRIFDLFRRAGAQDRPGEGIGLAHVRALVRRLGGTIVCDETPGGGATFRVTLPKTIKDISEEVRT